MRNLTVLYATMASGLLVAAMASCGDDSGDQLTVASASASTGAGGSTGGSGGTSTATGGTAASTTSTGGNGGNGGMAEQPVNGCLSTNTMDMTNQSTVSLTNPLTQPLCITVSQNTVVSVDGTSSQPGPLIVGGSYDAMTDLKTYDSMSPIQPACFDCQVFAPACWEPNTNSCYNPSSWTFSAVGAFGFYDNSNPAANRGAVYVVP
jgi:hypothetical protein